MSETTDPLPIKLHHVGYLAADLEAEAARFCAEFGYKQEGPVHEDPVQTARVCFLRLPNERHWLEIVSPLGPNSKLARALKANRARQQAIAWHHLAFEVPDVQAACEGARDFGWLPLGAPTPAVAFGGRRVAWLMNERKTLLEFVEAGSGPYSLAALPTPARPSRQRQAKPKRPVHRSRSALS